MHRFTNTIHNFTQINRYYILCLHLLGDLIIKMNDNEYIITTHLIYWTRAQCECAAACVSYGHVLPLVNTSHVSAKRLHPFEGLATVVTHKVFPLRVDGLVSVQSARRDEGLSAYFTPVRPLARVRPDVSSEVGAVAEALLAHRAAVGFFFALLAAVVDDDVVVIGVEGQGGGLHAGFQTGGRRDEVLDVRLEAFELLVVVTYPEVSVALLLLLLDLRRLRVLLVHAAALVLLTVLGLRRLHRRDGLMVVMVLLKRRRRRRRMVMGELLQRSS